MKISKSFCALIAIAIGAQFTSTSCKSAMADEMPRDSYDYYEQGEPTSDMFFSSDYVYEESEECDGERLYYYLRYYDPDANMYYVDISVDLETYLRVIEAIQEGRTLIGTLELNKKRSTDKQDVYTLKPMADLEQECSATEM